MTNEVEIEHATEQDWTEPWRPTTHEGEEVTITAIVQEAIGSASMCWEHVNRAGIFKSDTASWIAGGAINEIEKVIFRQQQEGPQPPSRYDQEIEDLRSEINRYDDKLYLIERLVEQQAPFGTDLANFRRRLLLLVRA